jgi:hypothetical protein
MEEIHGTQMSNLYKIIFKFLREGITWVGTLIVATLL